MGLGNRQRLVAVTVHSTHSGASRCCVCTGGARPATLPFLLPCLPPFTALSRAVVGSASFLPEFCCLRLPCPPLPSPLLLSSCQASGSVLSGVHLALCSCLLLPSQPLHLVQALRCLRGLHEGNVTAVEGTHSSRIVFTAGLEGRIMASDLRTKNATAAVWHSTAGERCCRVLGR